MCKKTSYFTKSWAMGSWIQQCTHTGVVLHFTGYFPYNLLEKLQTCKNEESPSLTKVPTRIICRASTLKEDILTWQNLLTL